MNWNEYIYPENEKPLDKLVQCYSRTSIFRTIAFIGDSLSSGEFTSVDKEGKKHGHDLYEYSWGQYIARKNGLTAYNFSKGGMTAKHYLESFANECGFWNPELAAQAYVIALGVNDIFNQNMEIGTVEDIDPIDWRKNKQTFIGYYAAIISRYKEISPKSKFFLVTFPNGTRPGKEQATIDMVNLLYKLTEIFDNSYVIDLYKYAPYYGTEFKERYYLNGHMSPEGYLFTAEIIDSYIDYIVRHNYEDFKEVGFIGTNIDF